MPKKTIPKPPLELLGGQTDTIPSETPHLRSDNDLLFTGVHKQDGVYSEKVGNMSPGTDAMSLDQAASQLVVEVPFSLKLNAQARYLGYAYVDTTNKLRRVPPICHPLNETQRCRRITNIQGVRFTGDVPKEPVDLGAAFPRPDFATYYRARMTLNFETVPFKFKTDETTTDEFERWTYKWFEPGYQSLFIEGDVFAFDGGIVGQPGALSDGSVPSFPGGRNIPLSIGQLHVMWYDVPLEFIANSDGFCKQFMAGLNHLNDDAFLGYPKYTLLCDVPKIHIRPNPLPPDISTDPMYLANVEFLFHYFDPKPLGDGVTESQGHNMALYRGDGKWYPASRTNSSHIADKMKRLYETFDMKKLFKSYTA